MSTKVCIIDVDLGININDIVAESVAELTGESKNELDTALDAARTVQKVKTEREQAAKAVEDKLTNCMNTAYSALIKAGEDGLAVTDVMKFVEETIPTTSAFALRMKKLLSAENNKYRLDRSKKFGVPFYRLLPFN